MRVSRQPTPKTEAQGARWTYTRSGYALAQSLRQLKRHKLASLGTLLVLGITLSLPSILYFASATLAVLGERSLRDESLTAYLVSSVNDEDGINLAANWQAQALIEHTEFISREQALAMLQEDTDIGDAISVLGNNPLPGAIIVYPDDAHVDANQMQALAESLRKLPQVDRVQLDLRWVRRLEAAVALIAWIGGMLAVFLTLTALVVIANTIRLELARRRSEMQVSSLLGASPSFINRPIMFTGALYGFLGGLIACIIALGVFNSIKATADELTSLYQSSFVLRMPDPAQILLVLGVATILGLGGAISSLYSSSRHLTHSR